MEIPQARRPSLSGYVQAGKLLPWSWVDVRMARARNYWITTHAQGYPSARPVWGLWDSPDLLFSTGSIIAKNIARDAKVQVNLESADELVIVEGTAEGLDAGAAEDWARRYNEKYHWDMPASAEGVFRVKPRRVLAWICDSSGDDYGVLFSNSATAWEFD